MADWEGNPQLRPGPEPRLEADSWLRPALHWAPVCGVPQPFVAQLGSHCHELQALRREPEPLPP